MRLFTPNPSFFDVDFIKTNNGYHAFCQSFLLWLQLWDRSDYVRWGTRDWFGIGKDQVVQERFWNSLDGYFTHEDL